LILAEEGGEKGREKFRRRAFGQLNYDDQGKVTVDKTKGKDVRHMRGEDQRREQV